VLDDSKISSTGSPPLAPRFPEAFDGLDLNFCRNPACGSYGVHPDPLKGPSGEPKAPPGVLRGEAKTRSTKSFSSARPAIRPRGSRTTARSPKNTDASSICKITTRPCLPARRPDASPMESRLRQIRSSTGGSARRPMAIHVSSAECARRPSRPASRHLRGDKNRVIFQLLCNEVSLAKICKITDTSYCDLYGKIDFFHQQVQGFTAQCEDFARVDFRPSARGSRMTARRSR